jgi:hypothetical protein
VGKQKRDARGTKSSAALSPQFAGVWRDCGVIGKRLWRLIFRKVRGGHSPYLTRIGFEPP